MFRPLLLAAMLTVGIHRSAHADPINTISVGVGAITGGPGYLWEYFLIISPGTQFLRGDSFTIGDMRGLLQATPLVGFVASVSGFNVTFTWNGMTPLTAGSYQPFTILSTFGQDLSRGLPVNQSSWAHFGSWSGEAHQGSQEVSTSGALLVPGPTVTVAPEPGTLSLLALGILAGALARRRLT